MKIYLYRTRTRQHTTDGVLRNEMGVRICDTAEHTPTMLPRGEYSVKFKRHRKYKHRAPWLQLVDDEGTASGFVIHGNGVHARGFGTTIIVGEHLVPGVVLNSHHYFRQIVKRIEKALARKQKVTIIIK